MESPAYAASDLNACPIPDSDEAPGLRRKSAMSRATRHSNAGEHLVPALSDADASAVLPSLLDQLLIGVVLADAHGHPRYANRAARDLLARHDGLTNGAGGLLAETSTDTRRLRQALALTAALAESPHDSAPATRYLGMPRRLHHISPLLLRLSPSPGPPPGVAIFITAPEHLQPMPREALAVAFGLTPREAALAGLLADGHELRDCARLLDMGEGTARNHLKHVFAKTVRHSQATLVAALCRLAGPCR
ncbi:helix-turn-helix transcriptional regulator [Dyella sp. C11]|uniref:helix-turn-helix transcriptional regulator n=1 Tax=Dyella sp. C11 TaxID=2126991 RepID=UPI0013007436|nr:helix-turn-helix transcriptional regulator [Dyella sp. C11]